MTVAYWNPTRRLIGEGMLEHLDQELEALQASQVLLVLGGGSFRRSPFFATVQRALQRRRWELSPPVAANPTVASVQELAQGLQGRGFDAVVGIGGGSVLDAAKLLALLLPQHGAGLEPLLEGRGGEGAQALPVVAIPTTAGTGSEVTPYASVVTGDRRKVTIEHRALFPRVALVDPLLTHSMPAYVTACTGFDALSQAIESYWAVRHTPFADTHALRAIPLIMAHLQRAVAQPLDGEARFAMALASCEAGAAISQTRTTAVHAVSYPLTSFFGIVHGHACALTLPAFIRYNAPALVNGRGNRLWEALGMVDAEQAARRIEELMEKVGLERRLGRLGLDAAGIERVIAHGFRPDRVGNNPRPLDPASLRRMLEQLQ